MTLEYDLLYISLFGQLFNHVVGGFSINLKSAIAIRNLGPTDESSGEYVEHAIGLRLAVAINK